jgi:AmpE protein
LAIERLAGDQRPARRFGWFHSYCSRLAEHAFSQRLLSHSWGLALVLAPVLLLTLWLQWLAADLGWLFALAFGVFALLMSIGPGDLGDDAEAYIEARDAGDDSRATALAQTLCLVDAPDTEPRRSFAVARAIVVLANRRLVAPVAWFLVLGPIGAFGYRLTHLLADRLQGADDRDRMQRRADTLRDLADWLPARITATGYAVAGSFDAVAQAWRDFEHLPSANGLRENDALLANVGLAALDTFPDDGEELAGDAGIPPDGGLIPPVVEDAMALVWRSLVMWVALIGGGSLIAALT